MREAKRANLEIARDPWQCADIVAGSDIKSPHGQLLSLLVAYVLPQSHKKEQVGMYRYTGPQRP